MRTADSRSFVSLVTPILLHALLTVNPSLSVESFSATPFHPNHIIRAPSMAPSRVERTKTCRDAKSADTSDLNTPMEDQNNDDDEEFSLKAFQKAKAKKKAPTEEPVVEDFDGYGLRDAILEKWGECYDVDFQRVDALGFRNVYLNVMPFKLGRRPFRHETELDYLCHLQAVVEILVKYGQLDYVLYQIADSDKKPIAGQNPIVAVPIRLDLTKDQVETILRTT
jgi:hypothetical protein